MDSCAELKNESLTFSILEPSSRGLAVTFCSAFELLAFWLLSVVFCVKEIELLLFFSFELDVQETKDIDIIMQIKIIYIFLIFNSF